MKTKYNWPSLKSEYFLSSIMDVATWGRQFFGSKQAVKTGNFYKHTKHWRQDKEAYQTELQNQTLAEVRKDRITNYVRLNDKLFNLIEAKMNMAISVKDLHLLWQMITTAQGLPTRISELPASEVEHGSQTLAEAILRIVEIDEQKARETAIVK